MKGHRLGGILDAANPRQASVGTERIVRKLVAGGPANYGVLVPRQDTVEQAHGPGMRDQRRNVVAGHQHGGPTAIMIRLPWAKGRTMVSAASRASAASRGRPRAAGFPVLRFSRRGSVIRVSSAAVGDTAMS